MWQLYIACAAESRIYQSNNRKSHNNNFSIYKMYDNVQIYKQKKNWETVLIRRQIKALSLLYYSYQFYDLLSAKYKKEHRDIEWSKSELWFLRPFIKLVEILKSV